MNSASPVTCCVDSWAIARKAVICYERCWLRKEGKQARVKPEWESKQVLHSNCFEIARRVVKEEKR